MYNSSFHSPTTKMTQTFLDPNILDPKNFGPQKFGPQNFGPQKFWTPKYLDPKIFGPQNFWTLNFGPKIFESNIFGPNFFWTKIVFTHCLHCARFKFTAVCCMLSSFVNKRAKKFPPTQKFITLAALFPVEK